MVTMSKDEVEALSELLAGRALDNAAYRMLHNQLNRCLERFADKQKRSFKIGDRVKWRGKDGATYTGIVRKINTKNIDITRDPIIQDGRAFPAGITRAHPSLLEKIT